MQYLTTIYKIENSEKLLQQADGLIVGIKNHSTRETSSLSVLEFEKITAITANLNKKLYVSFKMMLHEPSVVEFNNLIKSINDLPFTGYIIGDIGYYYLLKETGKDIIYNPETLLTNTYDLNTYFDLGIKGTFISKEVNFDEIKTMLTNKKGQLFMTGHGYLNMFYSRRLLLNSYLDEINKTHDYHHENMRLKEEKRAPLHPIIEDQYGTHVYRSEVTSTLDILDDIDNLDYLVIDSIFHDDDYALDILNLYKNDLDLNQVSKLQEKYNETWDTGFLYLKTIYKV
ncbi:MAG: U32 family peptidase [Acholeplasmataceae bacterium]|nr:U32 family peptidase [Acholeplasmataceae bacterium]